MGYLKNLEKAWKARRGKPSWNSGTGKGWLDVRGYRWIYVMEDGRRRARREHRIIVERHLGRKLEPWELVHHKNGNRSDNQIENLQVTAWNEHTMHHHYKAKRADMTKLQMEVLGTMRYEIQHLRRVIKDLRVKLARAEGRQP